MWWEKYIGVPFLETGRTLAGCDCWGLVRIVYRQELGILLPSWSFHKDLNDTRIIENELSEAHKVFEKIDSIEPFSIALISSQISVLHVGIVVNEKTMLHTLKGKDACIAKIGIYDRQLKGFYRHHDQNSRQA